MGEFVGERFILCLKCKQKIPLPEGSIPWEEPSFSVRYEIKNNKMCLYAKCANSDCAYDNLYNVDELLHGKSTEVK